MAYILGFMYADGNIVKTKRGTHFISIYTADESILRAMRRSFCSNHMVSKRVSKTGSVYRLQIGSREWFTDLGVLGLQPAKTSRMQVPTVPPQYFGDFLRGYFDGDGNVWSGLIHRNRPVPTRTLQVAFTSCSREFLNELRNRLQRVGVQKGSIYTPDANTFARLLFSKSDALTIYKIMYNGDCKLFLKRKKDVFEEFVKNCGGSSTG